MRLEDNNNFGVALRNKLWEALRNNKISYKTLNQRLKDIPKEYRHEIIIMCEHNKYKRVTDIVEQILLDKVYESIMKEVLDEEGL